MCYLGKNKVIIVLGYKWKYVFNLKTFTKYQLMGKLDVKAPS
ncbi:MAG: hypothetical protein Terrestrivirus3_207 [Terrestrivirus sp.]|uniref:Uncharacterized protein n=1 Tax=Terrestrivirus sp. TaxID=2487775 RepID=A0A3G4ZM73_9VIRU|nr:MAG: hypothetical protein Terrestrivirus3_207 [Terrestrivirus sp.]